MDNKHIDIASEGRKAFDLAIAVSFAGKHSDEKMSGWRVDKTSGLILYWLTPDDLKKVEGASPVPFPMNAAQAADFAWNWLAVQTEVERKGRCDHDGSNGHGFRVHATKWGHVEGESGSICAVQPIWAWYGK